MPDTIKKATIVDTQGRSVDKPYDNTPKTALYFNGVNSMVSLGDDDAFSVATTGALSISAWICPDVLTFPTEEGSGYVHWLSKVDTGANEWVLRMYGQDNTENRGNRISFYVYSANGLPQGDGVAFQDNLLPNQWIHIVGTIDASNLMNIYKNGVQRDSFTTALTLTNTTTPVRIGSGAQNANPNNRSYFKGRIRDVIIWSRALTVTEAAQVYTGSPPATGMVAHYPTTEGIGSIINDVTGARTAFIDTARWVVA